MKVLEITNVDFALRHFILPLMRGVRARGHEVVATSADGPLLDVVRAEGFRVVAVPLSRSLSPIAALRGFWALYRLIRAEKPDLVHAHMPISGFLGRLAARLAGVPTIAYTCHGFLFNQSGPFWRRWLGLAMEWIGGRVTDIYLTVSTAEAADARRLRIARNAIAVGNGRDPAIYRPNPEVRAAVRAEMEVPEDRAVVIVVSRLVRHKGYPELLDAMRYLATAEGGAELWVVGERLASDHGEDMGPYFAQSGLGDRLQMLGYREDIADLMAAADIFTLPSHFEGLPMSVIEAMLCGLPTVCTDIPGPREQVIPWETGILVPVDDAPRLAAGLACLVRDPELRARMGEAARTRALALYDEGRVVARTLDLLGL